MRELTAPEVRALLDAPAPPQFLDVRNASEVEIASVVGATHIPMGEVPARLAELDPARSIVVMCHHGGRSRQVAMLLERNGFAQVINLSGGIAAWSELVDPEVPQY